MASAATSAEEARGTEAVRARAGASGGDTRAWWRCCVAEEPGCGRKQDSAVAVRAGGRHEGVAAVIIVGDAQQGVAAEPPPRRSYGYW